MQEVQAPSDRGAGGALPKDRGPGGAIPSGKVAEGSASSDIDARGALPSNRGAEGAALPKVLPAPSDRDAPEIAWRAQFKICLPVESRESV
jgi:hypothetical protein